MEETNEVIDGVSVRTYLDGGDIIVEYSYDDRNARTVIEKNTNESIKKFDYDSLEQMKTLTIQILKENN